MAALIMTIDSQVAAQPVQLRACGLTNGEPNVTTQLYGLYVVYWSGSNDDTLGALNFDATYLQEMNGTPFNGVLTQYYEGNGSAPACSTNDTFYNNNLSPEVYVSIMHNPAPLLIFNFNWQNYCNDNPGGEEYFVDYILASGLTLPNWLFVIQLGPQDEYACQPTQPWQAGNPNPVCNYHNVTPLGNRYVMLNYPSNFCGNTGNVAGLGRTLHHEYAEAITDPDDIPNATFPNAPMGWTQPGTNSEIGDLCQNVGGMNVEFAPNGSGLPVGTIQPIWSNEARQGQGSCVYRYSTDYQNFYLGSDGAIWRQPTFASYADSWGRPNTPFASAPAAASWGPWRFDVVAFDTNNHLGHLYQSQGSNTVGWEDLGAAPGSFNYGRHIDGTYYFKPAITSWGNYRVDIFATGQQTFFPAHPQHIWQKTWDNGNQRGTGWQAWSDVTGNLTSSFGVYPASAPTTTTWGFGDLEVFVKGSDGSLYWAQSTDGVSFGGWTNFGAPSGTTLTGNPGACSTPALNVSATGQGLRDVVFVNSLGSLSHFYHNDTPGGLTGWETWPAPAGHTLIGDPAVASMGDGRVLVSVETDTGGFAEYLQDWTPGAPTPVVQASYFDPVYYGSALVPMPAPWP